MSTHTGPDKRAYVRAMFAAIAGRYDLINSLLSLRRDTAWRRFAAREAVAGGGRLALDVAAGTGEMARHLARQSAGISVAGVDFSPEMLAGARAKIASQPYGRRVHLIIADALHLPFPDNTFDCVTIGFGLRNVTDIEAAFREMARVARPGARVVSLELTLPSPPLLRRLYAFGLARAAPLVGRIAAKNRAAYEYLPDSIMEHLSPEQVAQVMRDAGLQDVVIHRLTLGAATVHVGIKRGRHRALE